ncbi:HNH endonuclease signature motif containing protein [Thalassovita sp.]|uniref:HNH endonuclease signature motif containing protein n=1 Tax=Thalassovita sp. TaxID=1979401 RepID=UPI002B27AD41|nr:HNH endonuclease signature motif containing protein [Thalassovita sp.]
MCGASATVVDHIKAHRGDERLFWDRTNWQPLCAPCHNRHKQRQERAPSETPFTTTTTMIDLLE